MQCFYEFPENQDRNMYAGTSTPGLLCSLLAECKESGHELPSCSPRVDPGLFFRPEGLEWPLFGGFMPPMREAGGSTPWIEKP